MAHPDPAYRIVPREMTVRRSLEDQPIYGHKFHQAHARKSAETGTARTLNFVLTRSRNGTMWTVYGRGLSGPNAPKFIQSELHEITARSRNSKVNIRVGAS